MGIRLQSHINTLPPPDPSRPTAAMPTCPHLGSQLDREMPFCFDGGNWTKKCHFDGGFLSDLTDKCCAAGLACGRCCRRRGGLRLSQSMIEAAPPLQHCPLGRPRTPAAAGHIHPRTPVAVGRLREADQVVGELLSEGLRCHVSGAIADERIADGRLSEGVSTA